jgi:heme/copper-type cytochrome/quinol oxidase subunit 4
MSTNGGNAWKSLGLALAATPIVSFVGMIVITLIGALDDAITTIQSAGHWWVILVVAYVLSLVYFLYAPTVRQNRERKKVVDSLILYWQEQLAKQNTPQPSDKEVRTVHDMFRERVKVWAWFDPELWNRYYPDEEYSTYLFGIVDNFMECWAMLRQGFRKDTQG